MKKVKVLMATYNGEKYVVEQINSILNQNSVSVQLVISDDGSKDKTLNLISTNFPEIFVKTNLPGTGSAAKNFLKMIVELNFDEDFEYVSFADQDDIWLSDKLIAAINLLDLENASLYCSNMTKWDNSSNIYSLLKKDFPQKEFDYLFEGGSAGCTYVFTREFAQELVKFLEIVDSSDWKYFSHDWLVYFFARSRMFKVVVDNNSFIHYRIHTDNVHGHLNKLSWRTIKEKASNVISGYYQEHAKNYIKYLKVDSEEYSIYNKFLSNYFTRNFMIFKYNTRLMRDNKKFLIFALLNLLKIK